MLPFEFTRPELLILIVPIAIVLGVWFARSLSDFPRSQRIASLVTRATITMLLVLALAGLTWLHRTNEQFVLFVVDQSLSVGENAEKSATEFLKQAVSEKKGTHRIAYLPFGNVVGDVQEEPVEFGSSPSLLGKQGPAAKAEAPASSRDSENMARRDGTNLAAAIEAAAGYMPPGYVPQIVLLTDGNQTAGNATVAASRSPVPISAVPLPTRTEPEVQVSEVGVPAEVREGEPFYVDVIITSNHADEGLVEVFRGDHKVISEIRQLAVGENRFRFQQSVDRDRMATFKVRVSGLKQDTLLDNNSDSGLVYTAGKPRVLIIESDPDLIRELAYALEDEGIQVDVRPPQGMPDSLAGFQNYELLILSNVPATALTQQQMEIARTYVQELGGGFIMLGGEQSFGLGGYYKSTLEEILPVRSDFEKEKEKPSLGIVLVIDRSGSMDGDKLEMAKTAARSAVELLGNRDQVAVLAFDDQTYVISEMQSASNKGKISDEISRVESGGGTSMYPAMEMSFEILNSTSAKLKHVIMLTDGISNTGDFEGMAQQMVSAKMTVSTVAVGGEGSTDVNLLESIARIGKGRYYLAEDPSQVPQIFAKETVTASKSAIDEQPFVPQVVRATRALAEIDLESAPFLLGYVTTRPKPTCEVILATEKGDPLLAWWRYGLGMTAAFTSDAKSRWAAEWLTWPGYGKFWTQVVRQMMRKSDTKGIQVAASRDGRRTSISVDAVNDLGQFINNSEVEITMIDPSLRREKSLLKQTAPGKYAADIPTAQPGAYNLEIALKKDGQVLQRQSRGLMVGYSDELRIQPTNETLLKQIASTSGGLFNPDPAKLFHRPNVWTTRPTPLWPTLLTLAAVLLVLDVALRRIDFALHWPTWKSRS
ncbi:MAG: VWA domain-containing protein [Planctomycetaceae bacterium]